MPFACNRKPLVLAIMAVLTPAGLVLAGNIVQTPTGGAVIVTDEDRSTQRFRVNATGEVYIPGLPGTDAVGTDLTCFRGGAGATADGQLVKCAPGLGVGPQGEIGPQGPQGVDGAQGPQGETGAAGAQGPEGAQGVMGPQGETGPQGPQGAQGEQGIAGKTILSGEVPPQAGDGVDGDYWLDTDTQTLYGPKVAGAWPAGVSLIGPQGPQGAGATSGYQRVSGGGGIYNDDSPRTVTAACPDGTYVVGGGFEIKSFDDDPDVKVTKSMATSDTQWSVTASNTYLGRDTWNLKTYAICISIIGP
ncbi:Collagen triple helix repeat-containing protein [Thiocapsa marina 5811]|uniref:Collagen triple helix repeat-containing protein n=1 Tax=Thiocapsa marina 5811 TaxID=768671 RepID=F9UIW4_9GAMM|nr:Collagen triple helix repeat-containing protein [Thiocapsa marina 5811]